MARDRTRVGALTVFLWEKKPIGYCDQVEVSGIRPVVDPVPIHPLNERRPIEIITTPASNYGTLTLTLIDLYNKPVWDRLELIAGSNDLVDIFNAVAALDNGITVTKVIIPPKSSSLSPWSEDYKNCIVADLPDQETIRIDSMMLPKTLTLWYTHSIKNGKGPSEGKFYNAT